MPHYRDYAGPTFPDIEALANYRVRVQAPLFGDATCPAVEYTFAVSEDRGETWLNPSDATKEALKQAVQNQLSCCRNLGDECPVKP